MAPFWKHASKDESITVSSSSAAGAESHRRPDSSSSSSSSSSGSSKKNRNRRKQQRQQQQQQPQLNNNQQPIPTPSSSAPVHISAADFTPSRRSSNRSISFKDTVSYSPSHGGRGDAIPGVAEMERRWSAARQASIAEREAAHNSSEAARTAADGSADETTGILGADSNGGQRAYNTNGPANGGAGVRSASLSSYASTVRSRRRADGANGADGAAGDADLDAETKSEGWWKRLAEKYGSVELDNKGSVARDHLALERTFLAWLRTSLSFASIGIAVTQLFRLNTSIAAGDDDHNGQQHQERLRHVGKPLGATFIAISIVILFIGFHRYFESQHYVIRGKFPASRGSIVLVSAVAGALIVSSLVVVLVVAPQAFERR